MSLERKDFAQRARRVSRNHRALSAGYVSVMRRDGLIVARPQRASRGTVMLRMLAILFAGLILFKSLIMAGIGPDAYTDRVAVLQSGTVVEQAGAWLMQPDPASQYIAAHLRPYLR